MYGLFVYVWWYVCLDCVFLKLSLRIPGPLPAVTELGDDVKPKEEKELEMSPMKFGVLPMYEDDKQEKVDQEYKWTFFEHQLCKMILQLPPQKRANISVTLRRHLADEDNNFVMAGLCSGCGHIHDAMESFLRHVGPKACDNFPTVGLLTRTEAEIVEWKRSYILNHRIPEYMFVDCRDFARSGDDEARDIWCLQGDMPPGAEARRSVRGATIGFPCVDFSLLNIWQKYNRDNVVMEAGESGETLAGVLAFLTKMLDENKYDVVIGSFENVKAIDLASDSTIDDDSLSLEDAKPSSALVQLKDKLEEIPQLLVAVLLTDPRVYGLPQSRPRYYICWARVPGVNISADLRMAFQDEIQENVQTMHLPVSEHLSLEDMKMPSSHPDFQHWYDESTAETGSVHWSREEIHQYMPLMTKKEYLQSDTHAERVRAGIEAEDEYPGDVEYCPAWVRECEEMYAADGLEFPPSCENFHPPHHHGLASRVSMILTYMEQTQLMDYRSINTEKLREVSLELSQSGKRLNYTVGHTGCQSCLFTRALRDVLSLLRIASWVFLNIMFCFQCARRDSCSSQVFDEGAAVVVRRGGVAAPGRAVRVAGARQGVL